MSMQNNAASGWDERFTWDERKRWSNIEKHGVDFSAAFEFDRSDALVRAEMRCVSDKLRLVAMAPIGDRVHVMVFTLRRTKLRIISLRRASMKEVLRDETDF
jgi:uncharacterized DUF497 family protein